MSYLLIEKSKIEGKYTFADVTPVLDGGKILLSLNVLKTAPELEDMGTIISDMRYREIMMQYNYCKTNPQAPECAPEKETESETSKK